MRVVIVAGGTGGHLFPGLAIARKLKDKESDSEITFIGRRKGLEVEIVSREGFEFVSISAERWMGMSGGRKVFSMMKNVAGFFQSLFILWRRCPQVVLGMGGYVAGPFIVAARFLGFPTVIHEQNLISGVTNRILGRLVKEIEVSFPEAGEAFPSGKVRVTGNPVREEILEACRSGRKSGSKKTLLIMGGSQGAHRINLAFVEALGYLKEKTDSWRMIHLSGREDYNLVAQAYKKTGMEALIHPFLHRMEEVYGEADLVVARAGATTIAEITVCGLPAILIPYPQAAHHHQEGNARWLEEKGAAIAIKDEELTGEKLAGTILSLIDDEEKLSRMAEKSRSLGRPEAAEEVVVRLMALARRH